MKLTTLTMTNEQLRHCLLTTDYSGKEWKEQCLNELLVRAMAKQHEVKETSM